MTSTGTSESDSGTSAPLRCMAPMPVEVSYVPYPEDGYGRVGVSWAQGEFERIEIEASLDGTVMTTEELPGTTDAFETSWGLAQSISVSGTIAIDVRLTATCRDGEQAIAQQHHEFSDPIGECELPDVNALPGNTVPFYTCAEAWVNGGLGCGPDGYLIGYGAKYAQKFYEDTRPRLSQAGQVWLDAVLVCLQTRLRDETFVGSSCADIYTTGFNQHPGCYADNGACSLPPSDLTQVALTIEAAEWATPESLQQVIDLGTLCGMNLFP